MYVVCKGYVQSLAYLSFVFNGITWFYSDMEYEKGIAGFRWFQRKILSRMFFVFDDELSTECYASSTAMLPGPTIPILSQVFLMHL